MEDGEERVSCPVVFEEQIFHACFFTGVAKHVGIPEKGSDGTDDGNDLVPVNEGVERDGEMRLRGEAAGDADRKTDFGGRCESRSAYV